MLISCRTDEGVVEIYFQPTRNFPIASIANSNMTSVGPQTSMEDLKNMGVTVETLDARTRTWSDQGAYGNGDTQWYQYVLPSTYFANYCNID